MLRSLVCLIMVLIIAQGAAACFGPKLYFGVGPEKDQELVFVLVSLYVHEKTGTESLAIETDTEPLELLEAGRADLALSRTTTSRPVLLNLGTAGHLVSGPRPLTELQFTLVPKALAKLDSLLKVEDFVFLRSQVADGEPVRAAVRRFLTDKGWI